MRRQRVQTAIKVALQSSVSAWTFTIVAKDAFRPVLGIM
jgi:hypothetical protein